MSHEQARRLSNIPQASPASIPRPPPLPAPKPLQRARDAAYRIIGYSTPLSGTQDDFDSERTSRGPSHPARYASLGATQNATASHKTGLEINTVAINESGTHALLGGREILKTVKIEDGVCAEDVNLRTAIRSTPTQASGKPRQVYSIDIADVAWAKGDCGDFVAAATSSGKIILYDIGHAGLQAVQLHEHYRQVHKVTFNPHRGNLLLSGSQDGTVRLWDVRDARNSASTVQSRRKFSGQSDGVRDVKWSLTDGVDFAFGTDSGWIQRWDIRNLKVAKVKIPAHALSCNTIDWHPDGKHILSASSDKSVRIWDFSTNRRQKPNWEIKTPYPVLNARWRPSCESSMPLDNGARQCTQIVTAYDRQHPDIHIWDFRRPALPFREMSPYQSAPTDLLWHSQDLLWTVGREGVFLQSDIQHAPITINKRCLQSFAVSPDGDIKFVTQKRIQRRSAHASFHRSNRSGSYDSDNLSVSPETKFLSRSWTDDSLDNAFLSLLPRKHHSRSNSGPKMAMQHSHTTATLRFDEIMIHRKSFTPQQTAVTGKIPYHQDSDVIKSLARRYCSGVKLSASLDDALLSSVEQAFNQNAQIAELVGFYRLAQSWRIVGFMTLSHLRKRKKYKCERQARKHKPLYQRESQQWIGALALRHLNGNSKSPAHKPTSLRPASETVQHQKFSQGTSRAPTPVARPVIVADPDDEDHSALLPSLAQLTADNLSALDQRNAPAAEYVRTNLHRLDGTGADRITTASDHKAATGSLAPKKAPYPGRRPDRDLMYSLPDDETVDLEADTPVVLVEMVKELIQYYSRTGDAQTTTHLISLLGPLLPRTHELSSRELAATVAVYADSYTSLGFLPEEIAINFDMHLSHTILTGLQPLQVESIFCTYHDQLMAHRLFDEAAYLRKLAFPAYPAVYEDAIKDNVIHTKCGGCLKPMESGRCSLRCESCNEKQAPCPICWLNDSPYGGGKLFDTCLLCNHSGHATCLWQWFEEAGGDCCPTGCGCDCVAGARRDEYARAAEKLHKSKGHERVKSDDWRAQDSVAVQHARIALGGTLLE